MKLTIYDVSVVMESQEQCDRMKQLCIDNNLPCWDSEIAFKFHKDSGSVFEYYSEGFGVYNGGAEIKNTQVTEQEFINLLNTK